MKTFEKQKALQLRSLGYSINAIAAELGVAKSSVSIWVRDVHLTKIQVATLTQNPFTTVAIERRRQARLVNELRKRSSIQTAAKVQISTVSSRELWLIGVMLYWAEGGKTQRLVRFSNGDPKMIAIMMRFFREVCKVPEPKFRGYIHIHPHLDHVAAEAYWSEVSNIPLNSFFKTYRKPPISSQGKRNSLPYGVFDIYVLDTKLFLQISGWADAIFTNTKSTTNS